MKLKIQTYYHTKFIAILFLISCSFWFKIASSNTMKKNIKNYNPDYKQLMKNSSHRYLNNPNNNRRAVFFNNDFKNKSNDYNKETINSNNSNSERLTTKDFSTAKDKLCSNVENDFDEINKQIKEIKDPVINPENIGGMKFQNKRANFLKNKYRTFSNLLLEIQTDYNNLISELDKINQIKNISNEYKDANSIKVSHLIDLVIDNMLDLPEFIAKKHTLSNIKIPLNNIMRCTLLNIPIVYFNLLIKYHKNIVYYIIKHEKSISSQIYKPLLRLNYILGKNIKEFNHQ